MELTDSQSERNLVRTMVNYSHSHALMLFYSKQATKEKWIQIGNVLTEIAAQKIALASRCYKLLHGPARDTEIQTQFLAGGNGSTEENLRNAAKRERLEQEKRLPEYAKTARDEGRENLADIFKSFINVSRYHERCFTELADNIAQGRFFKRDTEQQWLCRKCGYVHEGKEAPSVCIACAHPQNYFELLGIRW
jgi:rubrerythrin